MLQMRHFIPHGQNCINTPSPIWHSKWTFYKPSPFPFWSTWFVNDPKVSSVTRKKLPQKKTNIVMIIVVSLAFVMVPILTV